MKLRKATYYLLIGFGKRIADLNICKVQIGTRVSGDTDVYVIQGWPRDICAEQSLTLKL